MPRRLGRVRVGNTASAGFPTGTLHLGSSPARSKGAYLPTSESTLLIAGAVSSDESHSLKINKWYVDPGCLFCLTSAGSFS